MKAWRTMAVALALCALAQPAQAETITLTTGGFVTSDTNVYSVRLDMAGETMAGEGFRLQGGAFPGNFQPPVECSIGQCFPGATIDLKAFWSGGDISGTVVQGGRTFTSLSSPNLDQGLVLDWTGSLTIPLDFAGGALSAPFRFSGQWTYQDDPFATAYRFPLTGIGTAILTLSPFVDDPRVFGLDAARYEFAPTPEPASMVLLATGLAGVVAARRRQRRRSDGCSAEVKRSAS